MRQRKKLQMKQRENIGEGIAFQSQGQKSTKTVSRINRLTEEGKLKEMKTRKKKECWDKDSLFLRTVRATGIKTHMLHV